MPPILKTIKTIVEVASVTAPIAEKSAEAVGKVIEAKIESEANMVLVPDLCDPSCPMTCEQAEKKLSSRGLEIMTFEIPRKDAKAEYRECVAGQVVISKPKANSKVRPGEIVQVGWLTQEVIDESKRLYEAAIRAKEETKRAKEAKQQEQREKMKRAATDLGGKVREAAEKVRPKPNVRTKKGVKREQK